MILAIATPVQLDGVSFWESRALRPARQLTAPDGASQLLGLKNPYRVSAPTLQAGRNTSLSIDQKRPTYWDIRDFRPEQQQPSLLCTVQMLWNHTMSSSDYRRLAAECLETARSMSLHKDRARLTEIAARWSRLAQRAEAEELATA